MDAAGIDPKADPRNFDLARLSIRGELEIDDVTAGKEGRRQRSVTARPQFMQ
jgi:hypothetical protein